MPDDLKNGARMDDSSRLRPSRFGFRQHPHVCDTGTFLPLSAGYPIHAFSSRPQTAILNDTGPADFHSMLFGSSSEETRTSSSQTFTMAYVSSSQYFSRLCLALSCSSGGISLILGNTVIASPPLCTPSS